jgi:hypothetical protein
MFDDSAMMSAVPCPETEEMRELRRDDMFSSGPFFGFSTAY